MEQSSWFETYLSSQGGVPGLAFVVLALVGGVVWSFVARKRAAEDPETHMANDLLLDKRRGWVQGASLILMRLTDNAYLSEDLIGGMLKQSWGIGSAQELDATVARLVAEEKDAWGLLRAMLLLRSAVAVGWLSNERSFERCYEVGKQLQERYDSWNAMAADVLASRRARFGLPIDGSGDTEDMKEVVASVEYLAATQWRKTPWSMGLG